MTIQRRHLHFVGIGGCGMSGLARIAHSRGATVTGSDRTDSATLHELRTLGIDVGLEREQTTLPEGCERVIHSAAVPFDHPLLTDARRRGIPTFKYAQMLGSMMIGRCAVAVAGTHGKSTTTSLLAHLCIRAGLDPTVIVGANCPQIGGHARLGSSDLFIAEACEFDRSFHHHHPTHALILNIEADHLDVYDSLDAIVESFAHFAGLLPDEGSLLIQHESPHRLSVTSELRCRVETLGFAPQADWRVALDQGITSLFDPTGVCVASWASPLPGEHMAYNAAAAAVTAHRLGAPWDTIAAELPAFTGLDRRMQLIGVIGGVTLVDDYGHHPTEVDATLRALRRRYEPQRLICVFQPHQHSRTRFLMNEFAASFTQADLVVVPDIYFVRDSEQERAMVHSRDLVRELHERGVEARHIPDVNAIAATLRPLLREGDLLVTMGAGDVWKVAHALAH